MYGSFSSFFNRMDFPVAIYTFVDRIAALQLAMTREQVTLRGFWYDERPSPVHASERRNLHGQFIDVYLRQVGS